MKRANAAVLILVIMAAVWGCQPPITGSSVGGYAVMFEGKPHLTTPTVYHKGVEIGEVVSASACFGDIIQLTVALNSEYRDLMTENAVFYPAAGHLEFDRLSPAGQPLEDGSPVLGFSSKLSYNWYRVKNLLGSRKAAEKARRLNEKAQWAEPVQIPL